MEEVSPKDGGCWFCKSIDAEELIFDTEFDTYLHYSCLEQAWREVNLMVYLLEPGNSAEDYTKERTIKFAQWLTGRDKDDVVDKLKEYLKSNELKDS